MAIQLSVLGGLHHAVGPKGNNLVNFLKLLIDDEGRLKMDFEDEIVKGTCMIHNKELVSDRLKQFYA